MTDARMAIPYNTKYHLLLPPVAILRAIATIVNIPVAERMALNLRSLIWREMFSFS